MHHILHHWLSNAPTQKEKNINTSFICHLDLLCVGMMTFSECTSLIFLFIAACAALSHKYCWSPQGDVGICVTFDSAGYPVHWPDGFIRYQEFWIKSPVWIASPAVLSVGFMCTFNNTEMLLFITLILCLHFCWYACALKAVLQISFTPYVNGNAFAAWLVIRHTSCNPFYLFLALEVRELGSRPAIHLNECRLSCSYLHLVYCDEADDHCWNTNLQIQS